jgi:hypothetical protein
MIERFMAKVSPEPNSGCWLWDGAADAMGYGLFFIGDRNKNKRAHIVSYELHCGPVPKGLIVRHRCDVASCVNPAHLLTGTKADNMRDRHERNRTARGERASKAKLTEQNVREIRASIETNTALGKKFGVHNSIISDVRNRKSWRHI